MSLYAIADLHLGFGVSKPMSVFGAHWADHEKTLSMNWLQTIGPEDTVLIPGDISWGMTLEDALPDLQFLDRLPGKKILSRGNHDYWWSSLAKIERFCADHSLQSLTFLRNNSITVSPSILVCGTRGWLMPDDPEFGPADEKIFLREAGRLKMSLEHAQQNRTSGQQVVACLHYPPFGRNGKGSLFTDLLSQFAVDACVYGHVHGIIPGTRQPVAAGLADCYLVAADYLAFKPFCIFYCA
jgi:hypothetical protein